MAAQVLFLMLLAAFTADVAAIETECSKILTGCTDTFNQAKYDDWPALTAYQDCVNGVDCPDDVYAKDLKQQLTDDIDNMMKYWGRDWNVRDSAPHQSSSFTVFIVSAITAFKLCLL